MLSLDDVCMMMIMVMMVMLMTLLETLMIDDFDGALEMPDDSPLMEIAHGDGSYYMMVMVEPMLGAPNDR